MGRKWKSWEIEEILVFLLCVWLELKKWRKWNKRMEKIICINLS